MTLSHLYRSWITIFGWLFYCTVDFGDALGGSKKINKNNKKKID